MTTGQFHSNQGIHSQVKGELQTLLEVFARRKGIFAIALLIVPILAWVYLQRQTPVYEAVMTLIVAPENQLAILNADSKERSFATDPMKSDVHDHINTINNDRMLYVEMKSELQQMGSALDSLDVEKLVGRINAEMDESGGNLINVRAWANERQDAILLANMASRIYIKQNLNRREEGIRRARKFIESQLEHVKKELFDAQAKLSSLGQSGAGTSDSEKMSRELYVAQLEDEVRELDGSLQLKKKQRYSLQKRFDDIRGEPEDLAPDGGAAANLAETTRLAGMKSQLQKLEADLLEESRKFTPQAANVKRLEKQWNELKEEIASTEAAMAAAPAERNSKARPVIAVDYNALIRDLNDLDNEIASIQIKQESAQDRLAKLSSEPEEASPEEIVSYDSQLSKADINRELFRMYQMKLNNFQIMETMNLGDVRELAPAVNALKTRPREAVVMIIALFFSFIFAASLASMADMLDKRFLSEEEIESFVQRPIIGAVSWHSKIGSPHFAYNLADFQMEEAYRALVTNIKFTDVGRKNWAMFVTSAIAGEGKTTTSCYLAQTLSKTGKTLIVDADFRNPSVHKHLGMENNIGFTDLLVGDAPLEEAVQKVNDNFHVMSAGSYISNLFSVLFESEELGKIIKMLRMEYRNVIFDTSPIGIVSDTVFLGSQLDACLLVLSPGECQKNMVGRATQLLAHAGINVTGIILNKLHASKKSYYYYYRYKEAGKYGQDDRHGKKRGGDGKKRSRPSLKV